MLAAWYGADEEKSGWWKSGNPARSQGSHHPDGGCGFSYLSRRQPSSSRRRFSLKHFNAARGIRRG